MKNIIMTVLVIATALSGITVPTRTADALWVDESRERTSDKIKELLGTEDTTGIECNVVNSEIIWLADKNGNVIVDDRPIYIRPEYSEGVDNYGEGYSVTEGFAAQFKCESSYDWKGGPETPLIGPYPVAATWSSDNPDIADVEQNGVVTAKKPGKTVIRAKTLDSGREMAKEITVIRNWVKDKETIRKAKVEYVLAYDKNGDAVCKVTIKNTSKKKYKYDISFTIYNDESDDNTYGKLVRKTYKLTLKPKKSKTYTIKVNKLKRYQDITEKITMTAYDNKPKRVK